MIDIDDIQSQRNENRHIRLYPHIAGMSDDLFSLFQNIHQRIEFFRYHHDR